MSLLRMESSDVQVFAGSKWTTTTEVIANQSAGGKTCWGLRDAADLSYYLFDSERSTTMIAGCNWYGSHIASTNFISFWGDNGTREHIRLDSDGTNWVVERGGDNVVLDSYGPIASNTWTYIEFKVTVDNFSGSYEVRLNGRTIMSGTSADTKNGGATGLIDRVKFSTFGASGTSIRGWYRDFVIMNDAGSNFNDLIGPVKIEALSPDGAGNYTGFTPNTGANWQAVDDGTTIDSDTTYVEATSTGVRDSYSFANTTLGSVDAVQAFVTARYDVSPLSLSTFLRRSATDNDGSPDIPAGGYASAAPTIWETDPVAAGPWTVSNFNATEFGLVTST